jgi:hypothetical protein
MATAGEDPTPLMKFWERLQRNPSFRSVQQLWNFMDHEGIPLTPEGTFLTYKSINGDLTDHHTGQVDNTPGVVNEMPRNKISDDPNEACHYGYHVGALPYVENFGRGNNRRIIICEVDPENVVCVPYDSSQHKMRVCKYKVLGFHNGELLPSTSFREDTPPPPEPEYEEDPDDDDDEEETTDSTEVDEQESESVEAVAAVDQPALDAEEIPGQKSRSASKGILRTSTGKAHKNFDSMGMEDLMQQSLSDLRQYATYGLQIVGASKITGGKTALVLKIMENDRDE